MWGWIDARVCEPADSNDDCPVVRYHVFWSVCFLSCDTHFST